jgi:hypothetical protein
VDPELVAELRALVDQHRLRIIARLADRPADVGTLASELRLPVPAVRRHLEILADVGLVERLPGIAAAFESFGARMDRVGRLGRELAVLAGAVAVSDVVGPRGTWPHGGEPLEATLARLQPTPDENRTLRAHLVDGRLASIPAQPKKRQIVLRLLLERVFTEDRGYPEKEVNQRLALFHPDVAALRRYLVDDRYVGRDAGVYRRLGPRLDVPERSDGPGSPCA